MKKLYVSLMIILLASLSIPMITFAHDGHGEAVQAKDEHHKMRHDEVKSLLEQGYDKKEVFRALQYSKLTDHSATEILKYYKQSGSWDKTAAHFDIDRNELEKQRQKWKAHKQKFGENKGKIVDYLASYGNVDKQELEGYLNSGVRYHTLVKAVVLAKMSDTEVKQVIDYKRKGKNMKEAAAHLNLKQDDVHKEMLKVRGEIHALLKK